MNQFIAGGKERNGLCFDTIYHMHLYLSTVLSGGIRGSVPQWRGLADLGTTNNENKNSTHLFLLFIDRKNWKQIGPKDRLGCRNAEMFSLPLC